MKKALFLCCLALLAAITSLSAQEPVPAPEKETVVVDFFCRSNKVPAPYVEALREQVLRGFADRGRQTVIDAGAVRELCVSIPGTGLTTPPSAEADVAAFLQLRAPQVAPSGARYLVSGAVADYKFEHVQIPSSGKLPPRMGFQSSFQVLLLTYDLKLQQMLPVRLYTLTGTAPVAGDADLAALARIYPSMEFYVDSNFKFETTVLELCPPDKKGRVRELYIHCGTDMGVRPGDLFMVYEEVPIGGVPTRQKVGRLRVNDVQNTNVARCKIAKGDAEISDAFLGGRPLICISDGEALF